MNERIKQLRKALKISQETFSSKINISRSHYALIEGGSKNLTDRVISDICREFNVSEDWLRNGIGEMFAEKSTFSLDEYLNQKGATDLEKSIVESVVKSYFEVSENFRDEFINNLINNFKETLSNEDCACEYEYVPDKSKSIEEQVAEAERAYLIKVHGVKPEQLDTKDKILNFNPFGKSDSDKEHA